MNNTIKSKITKLLPITLAGLLQGMPLLRSVLPAAEEALASPGGSLILRWVARGVALFGYHAISSASSISISPPTATIGTPYAGTVTYSGSHAGSVQSMTMSNTCLGSFVMAPGLTLHYSGGHTASVTGTPTGSAGTVNFTVKVWDLSGCTGSLTDTRSTSLIIQTQAVTTFPPSITVAPQSVIYQIGSDIILSGGATGNPAPGYFWKQGLTTIPGSSTNTLTIPAAQLTNAGLYSLWATNSQGTNNASCFLTMAVTPGNNILAFQYTNYVIANTTVVMSSLITNVSTGSNGYSWDFNDVSIGVTTSNLTLSSAQTIPSKSGIYSVVFNSFVGSSNVVNQESYDSYWVFGYLPVITNQPSPLTVGAGSNATFNMTLAGGTYPTVFLYQNQSNLVAQTNLPAFNPSTAIVTTNISLTVSNVAASNAGSYTFVITNFWGSITSAPAVLSVTSPLSVSNPQGQTNYAGKNISFAVTAVGAAPLTYQWRVGSSNLADGGVINGATTNTLDLTPAGTTNSGNYSIVVTNSSGSVTSSVAALSILPLPAFNLARTTTNVTLNGTGGVPGSKYVVQTSTNLANSAGWTPILTNTVPANGSISAADTNISSNPGQEFYRIQFP